MQEQSGDEDKNENEDSEVSVVERNTEEWSKEKGRKKRVEWRD